MQVAVGLRTGQHDHRAHRRGLVAEADSRQAPGKEYLHGRLALEHQVRNGEIGRQGGGAFFFTRDEQSAELRRGKTRPLGHHVRYLLEEDIARHGFGKVEHRAVLHEPVEMVQHNGVAFTNDGLQFRFQCAGNQLPGGDPFEEVEQGVLACHSGASVKPVRKEPDQNKAEADQVRFEPHHQNEQ